MPGYGGLEVCQRLKESGETMRIPVLLSVGKMEPFKADEAKRVRADAHIVKPFEASELLAALAKLEDRIVPQGDAPHGRKSKKPSFWHGEDDSAARRDWTENAAYLAQVKERKSSDAQEPDGVATEQATSVEKPTKVDVLPPVPEAREELPVIAESSPSVNSPEEIAQQNAASSEPASASVAEGADVRTSTSDVKAIEAPGKAESESADSVLDRKTTSETSSASPIVAAETSPVTDGANKTEASTPSAGRWIAENVALTPEEAALELDQEMRAAEAAENMQPNAPVGTPSVTAPEDTHGATFAAAAGAGSSAVASAAGATNDPTEQSVPSEAAAAWENWQHIRETVMNGQTAAAIVETVAQAANAAVQAEPTSQTTTNSTSQEPAPAVSAATESSSSEMETGALASIVDSVLAELKPKLMEEIAKKLKK
jgi:hypothetical protein